MSRPRRHSWGWGENAGWCMTCGLRKRSATGVRGQLIFAVEFSRDGLEWTRGPTPPCEVRP